MKTATFSKKIVRKKVLVPAIIGVGILLSAAFIVPSHLENTWAQQQQWGINKTTNASHYGAMLKINGSVNVGDGIKNFFAENAKTPFVTAAQTAQEQIANGTVLGGHIGVTQGYLTYTYFVVNPTNDTAHKVIIDAGNGQVLDTSESKQIGSGGQSMFGAFEHRRGHEGFGGSGGGGFGSFGGFWQQ